MKKKKAPPVRINVCFATNAEPNDLQVGNKMSMLAAAPKYKMKRMFEVKESVQTQLAGMAPTGKKLNSKQAFALAYEQMPEAEKRLHRIWQIEVSEPTDVDAILSTLREDPNVEFAELEKLYTMHFVPNDPRYNELYGLSLLNCEKAWDITQGDNVLVAVVDSGVDYNHPDLAANMWHDPNNNVGRDFSGDGNNVREDDDPMDTHGHGTHVAGTIAAIGNNGVGVIGVAPKVQIMAVKVFPHATDKVIAKALKYAVDCGAKVINNSWGPTGREERNEVIEVAVDYVHSKGGICIFSAGNENDDVRFYSPANSRNVIAVAATDSNDTKASFSNYGDLVDVAAPGVSILSARRGTNNYVTLSGTSMAAPHVSGAVALLLSKYPSLSFDAVRNILRSTSKQVSSNVPIGAGRIDCWDMIDTSNATPLIQTKIIGENSGKGTYTVTALHPYTQAPIDGEIFQNGSPIGKAGVHFTVTLACQTKDVKVRVCDPELKPPCHWEIEEMTVCSPTPNDFLMRCNGLKDAFFKLPDIKK
jgi:thermitase